jgi:putative nucleotidyltransferase-like protein
VALARLRPAHILQTAVLDPGGSRARELVRSASRQSLEQLPALAAFHRVVGPVYTGVGDLLPDDIRARLERLYRDDYARRLIAIHNLRRSKELLEGIGVPFLVVKGPVLSELIYEQPGQRLYRDLDLIVPRASFATALAALELDGADVLDPIWPYLRDQVAGQVELSTHVDLHWHFLFFEAARAATDIRMDDVFERARSVTVVGATIKTPDPADTLIHLALHACLEGGRRLVWMKDLEQAVVNQDLAWEEVVGRARDWRVNLQVGTMLLRSRALLGTPVPDEVIGELVPRALWRGLLHSLDVVFPVTIWGRARSPAAAAAKATKTDVKSTLRFVAGAVGRRLRRESQAEAETDPEARAAYLERVSGGP